MDYLAYQIYFENEDFNDHKNVAIWKYTGTARKGNVTDGRWRWILFDLDMTLRDATWDTVYERMPYTDYVLGEDPLFVTLMRNQSFRQKLAERLNQLCEKEMLGTQVVEQLEEQEKLYGCMLSNEEREFFEKRRSYIHSLTEKLK